MGTDSDRKRSKRESEGVVSASAIFDQQVRMIELIAGPVAYGDKENAIARVARKCGLTQSKVRKAWKRLAMLRADEWERLKAAAAVIAAQEANDAAAREGYQEVLARLEKVEAFMGRQDQGMEG